MPPAVPLTADGAARSFFGHTVVRAAFVLAVLGWGIGFYGPPIFLHAVVVRTGWALSLVSGAVTLHFLFGALVVAILPRLHAAFGVARTTAVGALVMVLGVLGWAVADSPAQLFTVALLTGGGWVTLGAAAINAILSPWFVRTRPLALSRAYNGASVGGVVVAPLLVALIGHLGFVNAALVVGVAVVAVVTTIAVRVLVQSPERLGQQADGDPVAETVFVVPQTAETLPGRRLLTDRRFVTLAAAMALSLFAQIGLIAHLYGLLVPVFGAQRAGFAMGLATACAIVGRTLVVRTMPARADRRLIAAGSYGVQIAGSLMLWTAGADDPVRIIVGIVLFGLGIGNATSLPPLIAQADFTKADAARAVALVVAIAQATYAFAPAAFALLLGASLRVGEGTGAYFFTAAAVQLAAVVVILLGRQVPARRGDCSTTTQGPTP